jgi:hypothetical protein
MDDRRIVDWRPNLGLKALCSVGALYEDRFPFAGIREKRAKDMYSVPLEWRISIAHRFRICAGPVISTHLIVCDHSWWRRKFDWREV